MESSSLISLSGPVVLEVSFNCYRLTVELMNIGALFWAADLVNGHRVLVKISDSSSSYGSLQREHNVLDQLRGIEGIPDVTWSGMEFEHYYLVFEDLGPTLQDLLDSTGQPLPVNVVSLLAEQVVRKSPAIEHSFYSWSHNLLGDVFSTYPLSQLHLFKYRPAEHFYPLQQADKQVLLLRLLPCTAVQGPANLSPILQRPFQLGGHHRILLAQL